MKKTIKVALTISCLGLFGQENMGTSDMSSSGGSTPESSNVDIKSKRGFAILPEAGDLCLGISATTSLGYFGNLMSGTANNSNTQPFNPAPSPFTVFNNNSSIGNQLFLKKFSSSTSAMRLRVQAVLTSNANVFYVAKDELSPDQANPKYVTDVRTDKTSGLLVALGKEKRRGKGRVQGFYGAEGFLGVFSSSTSYNYGNAFSANFPQPTIYSSAPAYNQGARTVKQKHGLGFAIGVRPFIGVEYFFAPKISLAGEFGYSLAATFVGNPEIKAERWNSATNKVDEVTFENADATRDAYRGFGLSADNLNSTLSILFHF